MKGRLIILRIEKTPKGFETKHGIETEDGVFALNIPDMDNRFDLPLGSQVEARGVLRNRTIDVQSICLVDPKLKTRIRFDRPIHVM